MPSDEMVEKVARALCRYTWQHDVSEDRMASFVDMHWQDNIGGARAALEAAEAGAVPLSLTIERKIGMSGAAYDGPTTARAYTYKHQPNNLAAWRIGEAASEAAKDNRAGDYIDRGLILLKHLEQAGFGVFALVENEPVASPPSEASREERAAIRKEAFEEAAVIARIEAEQCASLGSTHPENSQNRDRLFARARSAEAIATAIRARGET